MHGQDQGQSRRGVCVENSSGRPRKHSWHSMRYAWSSCWDRLKYLGTAICSYFPGTVCGVFPVSQKETIIHKYIVCTCVCVCTNDLLHTPQHLDFFFYSVVSIHLHEDICLKLHLLDDLRLSTQTCHHPPLPRQMCPCSQSCQEWVRWLQDQASVRNAARARLEASINRLTAKLVLWLCLLLLLFF